MGYFEGAKALVFCSLYKNAIARPDQSRAMVRSLEEMRSRPRLDVFGKPVPPEADRGSVVVICPERQISPDICGGQVGLITWLFINFEQSFEERFNYGRALLG